MEEMQRNAIMENLPFIVTCMEDKTVLDHLRSVFNDENVADVQAKVTPHARNRELIRILTTKADNAPFESFIDALNHTNQKKIADRIRVAYSNSVNFANLRNIAEIAKLTEMVERLKLENEKKSAETAQLVQKMDDINGENHRKFEEIEAKFRQQFLEFTKHNGEELLALRTKLAEMQIENEQLNLELTSVKSESQSKILEINTAAANLQNKQDEMKSQYDNCKLEITELNAAMLTLNEKQNEIKTETGQLKQEMNSVKTNNNVTITQTQSKVQEIDAATKELQKKQQETYVEVKRQYKEIAWTDYALKGIINRRGGYCLPVANAPPCPSDAGNVYRKIYGGETNY